MDEFELNRRRVAVTAIAKLAIAFGKEMPDEQIDIYIDFLSDIKPDLLMSAVDKVIQTEKWFPPVSVIRADALTTSNELTSGEAWSFVCQRISAHGRSGGTAGLTALTRSAIRACGGYTALCESHNPSGDRYVFTKAYEAQAARELQRDLLSSDLEIPAEIVSAIKEIGRGEI